MMQHLHYQSLLINDTLCFFALLQLDVVVDNFGRSMLWCRLWDVSRSCCYIQKDCENWLLACLLYDVL